MDDNQSLIVVGVDGSAGGRQALAHAVDEAVRRGAGLRAVWVFERPEYWAAAYGMPVPTSEFELARRGEDGLRTMLDDVLDEQGGSAARAVPVTVTAVAGSPGRVLVDQAAGADLLVVGHRGRGGLASALLGSVGLYCVLHAPCPVTVVRPVAARATAEAAETADATAAPETTGWEPLPAT